MPRPVTHQLRGQIVPGSGRGASQLGYPTANIAVDVTHLAHGVYAGRARIHRLTDWRPAAISIGTNPTFGEGRVTCEVHVLASQLPTCTGMVCDVVCTHWLRDQIAFTDTDALVRAIAADCRQVEALYYSEACK